MNMLNHHPLRLLLAAASLLCLNACVSVNIGSSKATRSEDVRARVPAAPFQEKISESADRSWQSTATGSTISYFSECPQSAAGLEFLTTEFASILKDPVALSRENRFFNGREAMDGVTEGSLDGIDMKIASVVFKRNGCSYLISYVARKDRFAQEESVYRAFLEGFEAP